MSPSPTHSPCLEEVDCHIDLDKSNDEAPQENTSKTDFLKSFALFLLKLQGQKLVPESTIQTIVEELQSIHDICKASLELKLTSKLKEAQVSEDFIEQLVAYINFEDEWLAIDSVKGELRTKHTRRVFYKSLNFVCPVSIALGSGISGKIHHCHYVPLLDTIKLLLENESTPLKSEANCTNPSALNDITDGQVFRENKLFKSDSNVVPVMLFQDAFEVVNPLGSAKKKHKILAVYYSLGNIPPEYRSSIESLQLALLCKESDLKQFGQEKVFKRLIEDLKSLEESGIQLKDGRRFKGSLACIMGDNLGSHTIGGFVESFTAQHFCRFCLLTRQEFLSGAPYANGKCRTPDEYNRCVEQLRQSNESIYQGIKFDSHFNALTYYHVCSPGLPPCLGHDLFEGVVDYDLALFINYWVKEKQWFTYLNLNRKLEQFKFIGPDINNKPAKINQNATRLGGQAVENWCLMKLFPILFGQEVCDPSDIVWKLFLLLREIVQYVCAPQITFNEIGYLRVLIEEYLDGRKSVFPCVNLRPKHHFLSHYPELIVKLGPLIRLWTLRFESKHSYFKRCSRNCHNFLNITHTLSERHQMLQAYNSAGNLFQSRFSLEKGTCLNPEIFSLEIRAALLEANVNTDLAICSQRMHVSGTEYSAGLFVACEGMKFGCILLTILVCDEAYLLVKLHSATILQGLGVHMLHPSNNVVCVNISKLSDYYPLTAYLVRGRLLLPLKHNCFHF
ncbi:uncharacterized protein [Apostichopus japonicus]|uniref:uncharacterized protein n=1 Tax=Stichopus japonicus TaxID=307972 RepID=UPI003AB83ECF